MSTATLSVDLDALAANWRTLDKLSASDVQTGATVKADGYGLGIGPVARALARAGARRFFVAVAEEGATLRKELGPGPEILIYSGHMPGDTDMIGDLTLTPVINSIHQLTRHIEALPGHEFAIQLDSGMNRLGMEPEEWAALRDIALRLGPVMILSHLACGDEPDHPMNAQQLEQFRDMTEGTGVPRSLAATAGVLLRSKYHFEITRPGVGLFGGLPFAQARPVVRLSVPVIQVRDLEAGEPVGYGNAWIASEPTRIATVSAGYADGVLRAISGKGALYAGDVACPLVGRVSMDLITCDVSALDRVPGALDLLGPHQGVDDLAALAGTIGYEMLTALGPRYTRRYINTGTQ